MPLNLHGAEIVIVDEGLLSASYIVKDPASVKVHSVDILKLLILDPAYGLKFRLVLESMPAWEKYKDQDHSLYITGVKQKMDYFLTDSDDKNRKLLISSILL